MNQTIAGISLFAILMGFASCQRNMSNSNSMRQHMLMQEYRSECLRTKPRWQCN